MAIHRCLQRDVDVFVRLNRRDLFTTENGVSSECVRMTTFLHYEQFYFVWEAGISNQEHHMFMLNIYQVKHGDHWYYCQPGWPSLL